MATERGSAMVHARDRKLSCFCVRMLECEVRSHPTQLPRASIRQCGTGRRLRSGACGCRTSQHDTRTMPMALNSRLLTLMALVPARGGPVATAGAASHCAWLLMAAPITAAMSVLPQNLICSSQACRSGAPHPAISLALQTQVLCITCMQLAANRGTASKEATQGQSRCNNVSSTVCVSACAMQPVLH